MEIVEDRHGRGSLLITSQLPLPPGMKLLASRRFHCPQR
jgi:hypothetical protein